MSEPTTLRIERDGSVARVILARPEIHNAFDDALIARLTAAAESLGRDPEVRAVVLSGEGKSFCAGADLNWMRRMVDYGESANLRDAGALAAMLEAWDALPRPVIGRVHGAALGGGTGLVAICDVAVAAADTVFAFSEVRLGILPAVIAPFVVDRIGVAAARELFLTGDRFDAARAREIGLVHRVTPGAAVDAEVERVVASILAGGPAAQASIKKLLREVRGRSPEAARPHTTAAIAAARAGAEGQEGMRAFLERRAPAFRRER